MTTKAHGQTVKWSEHNFPTKTLLDSIPPTFPSDMYH